MKIIVGLGNPGGKYEKTRHNMGFMVVDKFYKEFSRDKETGWKNNNKFKSEIAEIEWQQAKASKNKKESFEKVILVKPITYMNNSGLAVKLISSFYKIEINDIWVIHDDVDVPFGGIKIKLGGSSGGHRGLESIISGLGTEKFWRFRLGIGHPRKKEETRVHDKSWTKTSRGKLKSVEDFVLGGFALGEFGKARELIKRGVKALELGLEQDLEKAMNRFNSK